MNINPGRILIVLACLVTSSAVAKEPAQDDEAITQLIDRLSEIGEEGVGYNSVMSGDEFLPLGISQPGAMLLFQKPPTESELLRELVKRGAEAVPHLIAHLDDERKTKVHVEHGGGFGGMFFPDEYDYNRRVIKQALIGVNRHSLNERGHPTHHTVTVGDLCFVALGQIVNRSFNAVRYQPTACVMINSPTYSERLRDAIQAEWGELTPQSHKDLLIRDFVKPDSESRREGACLRLGFYYPEALETLALQQLGEPRCDVSEVSRLIREQLYPAKDAAERKSLFDAFVSTHNDVFKEEILDDLFHDLNLQEHGERGSISPPVKKGQYAARECLIELFGYPTDIKSTDRPFLLPLSDSAQARFIDTLSYFPSQKIDDAVREILHSTEDDYLARACARFLAGRGADDEIRKYVEKRLPGAQEERRRELSRMLEQVGWTALHVAAETYDNGKLEALIRAGADSNARSATGQTPLHVAAEHGSFGGIRILLKYKADPNLKDDNGRTPVQLTSHSNAIDDLLAGGAEIPDILVSAVAGRDDLVLRFLQNDKAAVNARVGGTGDTALHLAAIEGQLKVAEVLLAHGADVNATDGLSKLTPLHRAATYASPTFIELLLAHGADPNAKSWDGKTPKTFAAERHNQEILGLLEK